MKVNRARHQKPAQNMAANSLVASRASVVMHSVIEARGTIITFEAPASSPQSVKTSDNAVDKGKHTGSDSHRRPELGSGS
jgi:hypothetical protein